MRKLVRQVLDAEASSGISIREKHLDLENAFNDAVTRNDYGTAKFRAEQICREVQSCPEKPASKSESLIGSASSPIPSPALGQQDLWPVTPTSMGAAEATTTKSKRSSPGEAPPKSKSTGSRGGKRRERGWW
jgi:hypothetical protein